MGSLGTGWAVEAVLVLCFFKRKMVNMITWWFEILYIIYIYNFYIMHTKVTRINLNQNLPF